MAKKGAPAAAANPVAKAKAAAKAVKQQPQPKKTRKIHTSVQFHRPKTLKLPRNPKYLRTSVPSRNKMDKYRVVKFPLTSESAMKKVEDSNTITFICDVLATKRQIKEAVKSLYDVSVKRINTLVRPDGQKKAFVRLSDDTDALDVANRIGII
eukprot:TRINITY_DN1560_c0_g1_i2.p1 TRINITY_DN1560_c0_g1~~TRINITY_DN1560_c0_g1_i2.p1  ORF type:complete len:153 (+),score=59.64 TRINITY_DN1560_c0_g1_i2:73-531(+)